MDLQLIDKVTLITGPAKGMGAAITLAFAREGARLVLAGRDTAAIDPVAAQARALGVEAVVVPCDLTAPAQTEALAARALAAFGRIDVLVNVAGGSGPIGKTGWETTAEEFNEIVQLNIIGAREVVDFDGQRATEKALADKHQCGVCHGEDLRGLGPVPPLAGRSPSHTMRQLFDMKAGARRGPWAEVMAPTLRGMSVQDLMAVSAYAASLDPSPGGGRN